MKKMRFLVFLFLFPLLISAQPQKGYVYLKNGTILKGKYQYTEDLSKLKIESAGNIWIFKADEIERVSAKKDAVEMSLQDDFKKSPLFMRTELGVLAGNSDNSQAAPFSFTGSLNYNINPQFSAGLGIGFEFLKETYLPAFANFEYKLRNTYATPYLFLKMGYQVPLEESNEIYGGVQPVYYYDIWPGPWPTYNTEPLNTTGGFLINPGLGYQRMFSSGFGMSFAFGYQFHRLSYNGDKDYRLDIDYNRLTIKLGFIFN